MGNTVSVLRLRHCGFIDMVWRQVTCDAGEQIDVALAHGLGAGDGLADGVCKQVDCHLTPSTIREQ